MKTVFLTALASAKRRGELHALSGDMAHTRKWGSVILNVIPGFVPKSVLATRGKDVLQPVVIPALTNILPGDHDEEWSIYMSS